MLKVRVIPTLLWKDFGLVKGVGFDSWRRVGPVLPAVKVYNTRDVDELVLVDIMASQESNEPDCGSVLDFAEECFVPLTVGGGITNIVQIQRLLRSGADKICINSAAYADPGLIESAAKRFGSQCVMVSIDVRRMADGRYLCFSHSGTREQACTVEDWARRMQDQGAGEILVTSIERDGTMQGYDLELIEKVVNVVNVPVIASGGAGNYEHMRQAIQSAGASAVAAASIFHFTEQTPAGAKKALAAAGVPVRQNYCPPAGH
ncbi:imidazole glycerol phosphate synthase subunit HisF [Paludibacterium yongneupense]|uniref:imidazole glycerol phosphate synthase subunit HisF n=1 Tax=Paludibacterium yongneupense TaxID=400061 RepID=UPI0003FAC9B7|nr:imidazole glycerol phosphate synthase cyclase subunit [Paludibacterium yongneupense]